MADNKQELLSNTYVTKTIHAGNLHSPDSASHIGDVSEADLHFINTSPLVVCKLNYLRLHHYSYVGGAGKLCLDTRRHHKNLSSNTPLVQVKAKVRAMESNGSNAMESNGAASIVG